MLSHNPISKADRAITEMQISISLLVNWIFMFVLWLEISLLLYISTSMPTTISKTKITIAIIIIFLR